MKLPVLLLVVLFGTGWGRAQPGPARDLVVVDEDWNVPGDFICESYLPMLLASPRVQLLALTCTSGDAWCDEGAANVLRFLEEIGRTDIPVAKGVAMPLANTPQRLSAWEARFGRLSWKGAWNAQKTEPTAHPDTPFAIRYAREGPPHHAAVAESAPDLMIRLVHEHPHQITFISGGPATNFALAMRKDPAFASLARRVVLVGLGIDQVIAGTAPAIRRPNFNFIWDPEAAQALLTAPWPTIVLVAPSPNPDPTPDAAWVALVQEHRSPASDFWAANIGFGTPLWSECAAWVADPRVATASHQVHARLAVILDDHDPRWGNVVLAERGTDIGRNQGAAIELITGLDGQRYITEFISSLQQARFPIGP